MPERDPLEPIAIRGDADGFVATWPDGWHCRIQRFEALVAARYVHAHPGEMDEAVRGLARAYRRNHLEKQACAPSTS